MNKGTSNVLLTPVITEKSTSLAEHDKYTFCVPNSVTKSKIKKAFEEIFPGRKVLSIKVLKLKGHRKRTKVGYTKQADGKKTIVTCEGPKIEYFPGVS